MKNRHIHILLGLAGLTFACAAFNSFEEQLPGLGFYTSTVFGAVAAPLFAVWVVYLLRHKPLFTQGVFVGVAYVVCVTALLSYTNYALNGKADSLHSAAHMHVIMFPIFHGLVTIIVMLIGLLIASLVNRLGKTVDKSVASSRDFPYLKGR